MILLTVSPLTGLMVHPMEGSTVSQLEGQALRHMKGSKTDANESKNNYYFLDQMKNLLMKKSQFYLITKIL